MKALLKNLFAVTLLFCCILPGRAQVDIKSFELENARQVLQNRNEVYFKFTIDNRETLNDLTQIISIDQFNPKTNEVFAYANTQEFNEFLERNIAFKTLKAPGLVDFDVKMATVEDVLSKGFTDTWDSYPTYEAYEALMYQFQTDFPNLCKIHNIGTMSSGRSLLFAKISANVNQKENEPRFMYTSTMHGDETTGYVLMLRLIHYLLNNYATSSDIAYLLNNTEIWICPNENPDGTYYGGNNTVNGARRYNINGYDLNRNYPSPVSTITNQQYETLRMMGFSDTLRFVMSANMHGGAEVVNFPWDSWYSSERKHADHNWWYFVSREYADTARLYSPSSYLSGFDNGVTHGADWYKVYGGRQDFMGYYRNIREMTLELSNTKLLPASQLPAHWNYNYRSLINYIKQSLYGVRGVVTDAHTGAPLAARVEAVGHDVDNSHVFANLPNGNYHRPLLAGTYNLKFSANGYSDFTVNNVTVSNYQTNTINVQLYPTNQFPSPTGLTYQISGVKNIVLNWNAPAYSAPLVLEHYKIYRNGAYLAQTSNLTYTDPNLNPASYSYNVIAVYSNPAGESNPSNTVNVNLAYYTITSSAGTNGSISPLGTLTLSAGANQTYTITPAAGYQVSNVLVNGSSVGSPTSYQFTNISSNNTIHANFSIITYTISALPNNADFGTVTGAGTYQTGETVTLIASPAQYHHFIEWKEGSASISTNPTISFTATANRNLIAHFGIYDYTITATPNNPSLGSVSGGGVFQNGQSVTLTAIPSANCHFESWTEGGTVVSTSSSFTFTASDNRNLVANFAQNTYTISTSVVGNGVINPSGSVIVSHNANQNFTFTPNSGSYIQNVKVDGVAIGSPSSYTFFNVKSNHSIEVTFTDTQPVYHTISISKNGDGTTNPEGNLTVADGFGASITFTPSAYYHIGDVSLNGTSVLGQVSISSSGIGTLALTNVTADAAIIVSFEINTYTISANAGSNGTISPAGSVTVNHGSTHTFNITPNESFHVSNVLVDGVNVGSLSQYTFENISSSHTITASFAPNQVIIVATAGPHGSIDPNGNILINQGLSQSFTITPDAGSHIKSVFVDGVDAGAIDSYTFTNVQTNRSIEALFEINTYTITASAASNGSISPSGTVTVEHGSSRQFTITPNSNYKIDSVLVDEQNVGSVPSYTFTNISANRTISAYFSAVSYTIAASAGENGSISPQGNVMVTMGNNQEFIVTPNEGYHILNLRVDNTDLGAVGSYTFTNVVANHTIHADFEVNSYTITATAGTNGSISPSGTTVKTYGQSQTYTITPNENYHVLDVSVNDESVGAVTSYTFSSISQNSTIHATFAIDSHTLTVDVEGNGSVLVNNSPYIVPVIFNHGASITLVASPSEGWKFDGWSNDMNGTENPKSFIFSSDLLIGAVFSPLVGTPSEFMENVTLYPNPFVDYISISNAESVDRITILNIIGEVVLKAQLASDQYHQIDVRSLCRGSYVILLDSKAGAQRVVKMVKAN